MSINLSTFWTTWGVFSGNTSASNQYDLWRSLVMTDGSPTPTPTPTPTPVTLSGSITPVSAITNTNVILTGTSNYTGATFIWDLSNFNNTLDVPVTSYTGNPLVEGYFTSSGSSNVTLTIIAEGQTATTSNFEVYTAGIIEANNYLNAVVGAGGTVDSGMSAATQTFFTSLFEEDLWDKLYVFYPFLGGTSASHVFNGKNPIDSDSAFRLTFNGGITHSADGMQPNGSNGYAETYFNAADEIGDGNTSSMGMFINLEGTGFNLYAMGVQDASDYMFSMTPRFSTNGIIWFDAGKYPEGRTETGAGQATATGMTIGTYRASNDRELYRNGSSLATQTSNQSFIAPDYNIPIGALYHIGIGYEVYVSHRFAFMFMGSGLTDSEVTTLSTLINDYQSGIGRVSY